MRLGLLITGRCNATCTHCTTNSSPHNETTLPEQQILSLMDQAAALRIAGDELLFCISGGEPFVDAAKLTRIVAHGAALGGRVTCTTNGYWASSDEKARLLLGALRQAGLDSLGVSTSRFHQQFIKLDRVRRALATAKELGIKTVLKWARIKDDSHEASFQSLAATTRPDSVESFPVVPYIRRGESLPEDEYIREPRLPEGTCPAATLTVREDGTVYTCCNPGGFARLLRVGNALDQGLASSYDRYLTQGTQQILRFHGPRYFAEKIREAGLGGSLRSAYADVCDLCGHIASNPKLTAVAKTASREFEVAQFQEMIKDVAGASSLPRRPAPTARKRGTGRKATWHAKSM
jgi:organic radical activating enzyme